MNKITFALIGAGRIGKMHAENIIANFPQVNLKTVVDLKLDFDWVKKSGIAFGSKNVSDISNDPEVKAVIITTPSDTHVDMIKQFADSGKQIFCEKPIAFDLQSIQSAINSVENAGVILQVGFNRRFDPDFLRVKNIVESGIIGKPHIIKMTNRDPKRPSLEFIPGSGGLFMDFCVHDFDMIRFLTGSDVEEIYVRGANLIDPRIGELGDLDTAVITLKLKNGAICAIDVCRETNYGYDQQVEVFGSKGSVSAQNLKATSVNLSNADGVFTDPLLYSFMERYKEAYIAEIKGFIECVEKKKKPKVNGRDAYKAVQIALAAQKSSELNQPVSMDK